MKQSYAVFGIGEFGRSVALELMKAGADVLACDADEELISGIANQVTSAIVFNARDGLAYHKLGLSNMDGVIICMTSNLEATIMAILAAKESGVPMVVAKAANRTQGIIFEKVGADRTVMPERDAGIRLARNINAGNFIDYIELSEHIKMVEMKVKPAWLNATLDELNLRERYQMNIIAVKRGGQVETNIYPEFCFQENDTVLVISDDKHIAELQ